LGQLLTICWEIKALGVVLFSVYDSKGKKPNSFLHFAAILPENDALDE